MTVTCPKCVVRGQKGERWHATGGRNTNRHGMRRAELVCDVCGYAFSSGWPAALAAAEAISGPDTEPAIVRPAEIRVPQPSLPGAHVQPVLRKSDLSSIGALVNDWKKKQAGDE